MNLVNICNSTKKEVIWSFIKEYDKNINAETNPSLDILIQCAINFYIDFIIPKKKYTAINESNKPVFDDLLNLLLNIDKQSSSEEIQTQIYEIGKKHEFSNLRDYFKLIYQVLLGQEQGPRLGTFIKIYGIENICLLIKKVIKEKKLSN